MGMSREGLTCYSRGPELIYDTTRKGVTCVGITVIKANNKVKGHLRVAAYCRVSTDSDEQEASIENQIRRYKELIEKDPSYECAGIFYDQGISGFKEKRPGFQEMMDAARAGKIDLIITKSITRFARNTDTILKATRELREMGIGVFFELQNINTLTQEGELMMTVYAAFAQGESETYRDLARIDKRRHFEEGMPQYKLGKAFGYKKGAKEGTFEIVPEEAAIIRQLYKWVKEEYAPGTILKMAKAAGFRTRNGKDLQLQHIYFIVQNEIYKGDYVMQKYFIDDERKKRINRGELPSWYIEDDHPAIVTKKLWAEANAVIEKRAEERTQHLKILPMTEENYPYKNKLHCGYCGERLYSQKTRSGAQYTFYCPKKNKKAGECCQGITVSQKVVESWGEITENIYITMDPDKPIPKQYSIMKESTWKKRHSKKNYLEELKPYTKENHHYYKRIFCEKCGFPLYRIRRTDGRVEFRCGGRSTYKSGFCSGMVVPEEVLDRLPKRDGYFILREELRDGEKHYSYSCTGKKPERKEKPVGVEKDQGGSILQSIDRPGGAA